MRIAEYLRRIGATDVPDVAYTCTCDWYPPYTGPGDPNEGGVNWDAECPVHDEDPAGYVDAG